MTTSPIPWTMPERPLSERVLVDVIVVANPEDSYAMVRHLSGIPMPGRALLRPTPGMRGRASLAADLLIALGKNPNVIDQDNDYARVGLAYAAAWIAAKEVTDVICDRAQDLPRATLSMLTDTVVGAGARLWLIWSGPVTPPEDLFDLVRERGHTVGRTGAYEFTELLPMRPKLHADLSVRAPEPWPRLPTADFPTFRAACRRHLPPAKHARVDAAYLTAARAAEAFAVDHCCTEPEAFDSTLVAFLRDRQIGPHTDAAAALIALRGTQAGLLRHGILLRWDTARCGPDPARKLPGTLTGIHSANLQAGAAPVPLVATALSLHLNVSPYDFGCWRLGDVDLPTMTIAAPDNHETWSPPVEKRWRTYGHRPAGSENTVEVACDQPIVLPEHVRPMMNALLAYRRQAGADDTSRLFVNHDHNPNPPAVMLRKAVTRTLARINIDAPWMHSDPCRHGADAGLQPRAFGWLPERGLTIHHLPTVITEPLPWRHPHRAHLVERNLQEQARRLATLDATLPAPTYHDQDWEPGPELDVQR